MLEQRRRPRLRHARHLFVILGEYLAAHAHAHLILNDALLSSLIVMLTAQKFDLVARSALRVSSTDHRRPQIYIFWNIWLEQRAC